MAELNKDLKDYLSRNEKNQTILALPSISVKAPDVSKWFQKSNGVNGSADKSSNGWFSESPSERESCLLASCLPSLSQKQRILGFVACMLMGMLCFIIASLYTPMLIFKARKFALLYTFGSLFMIFSFSFLWGPANHIRHLFSSERLVFTSVYFGTLFATLYFALSIQSTPLTVVCAMGQVVALVWFLISYIPGGQTGLKFFSKLFSTAVSSTVSKTLPV